MGGCLGGVVMARLDRKRDKGQFSFQLNPEEDKRGTSTQETIVELPPFGDRLVSMYVPRNLLEWNSSTLEEEFSPQTFFP